MSKDDQPLILYVDDEPLNLRVFEANFRSRFRIECVASGQDALNVLAERGHEIAVLISDQRMPKMTGVELLEKARAQFPDMQRMLLTAYSDMQAVTDAINRGQVSRYFVKPWIKEELIAALEDAVRMFQLQARLREYEVRLLSAESLAVLGQNTAGITHELTNPVSWMSQNVAALQADLGKVVPYLTTSLAERPDPEVKEAMEEMGGALDDVLRGVEHIGMVIRSIRGQVKGEDPDATANLGDVAEFAAKIARAEVRKVGRVTAAGPKVRVVGGPGRLCQVLLNLMVNAAHAMEGMGRPGLIQVTWTVAGDRARVEVVDNGPGIPEDVLARLFTPFFTTKKQGTGLGLMLSRQLVQGMGGELEVSSRSGEGTTFRFSLQVATTA